MASLTGLAGQHEAQLIETPVMIVSVLEVGHCGADLLKARPRIVYSFSVLLKRSATPLVCIWATKAKLGAMPQNLTRCATSPAVQGGEG